MPSSSSSSSSASENTYSDNVETPPPSNLNLTDYINIIYPDVKVKRSIVRSTWKNQNNKTYLRPDLKRVREIARIPNDIKLRHDFSAILSACRPIPPQITSPSVCITIGQLGCGLSLPFSPLVRQACNFYNVSPGQLHGNFFKIMRGIDRINSVFPHFIDFDIFRTQYCLKPLGRKTSIFHPDPETYKMYHLIRRLDRLGFMGKLEESNPCCPEFPILVSGNFNGFDDELGDGSPPLLSTTRVEEKRVNCDNSPFGPPHLKIQGLIFDLTEDSFYRLLGLSPAGRCLLQEPIPTRASLSYAEGNERSGWDALRASYRVPDTSPIPVWHKEKIDLTRKQAKPSIPPPVGDFDLPSDDDEIIISTINEIVTSTLGRKKKKKSATKTTPKSSTIPKFTSGLKSVRASKMSTRLQAKKSVVGGLPVQEDIGGHDSPAANLSPQQKEKETTHVQEMENDPSKEGVDTGHHAINDTAARIATTTATSVEVMHNSLKRKGSKAADSVVMESLGIGEQEEVTRARKKYKNMKASELTELINTDAVCMLGKISCLTSTALKLEKELESEKQKTKNVVASMRTDIESKDMLIDTLKIDVQQLIEELRRVESDLEKVKSQKYASDFEVARLSQLEKQNSNEIKTLSVALSTKDFEKSELQNRINSLNEEFTIARKEVQNNVEQRLRDGAAIDAWKARCALRTDQNKKLIERIKQLEEEDSEIGSCNSESDGNSEEKEDDDKNNQEELGDSQLEAGLQGGNYQVDQTDVQQTTVPPPAGQVSHIDAWKARCALRTDQNKKLIERIKQLEEDSEIGSSCNSEHEESDGNSEEKEDDDKKQELGDSQLEAGLQGGNYQVDQTDVQQTTVPPRAGQVSHIKEER